MEDFTCNICATELSTELIQIEKKYNIDVAYIIYPDCENRFNLMFDNRKTTSIKNKIKQQKGRQSVGSAICNWGGCIFGLASFLVLLSKNL